jgi:hypothetical protein
MTLYLRNVPISLVRRAKVRAAQEGTTWTAVVVDALDRALAEDGRPPAPASDELGDAMEWYRKNQEALLREYQGEYIAIVDNAVMDHDADFSTLATRVFDRIGVRPVLMPRVTEGLERVHVRSPRLLAR